MNSFFSKYSDEQLKKILVTEITSKTHLSQTAENIFEELKSRTTAIKFGNYTLTDDLIDYLSKDSNATFADYCLRNLALNDKPSDEDYYSCLPLCVIDSIFSIGVKYESVKNVIQNVSVFFDIPLHLNSENPNDVQELSVSECLKKIEDMSFVYLAEKVFNNKQRTSTSNGILKSEAVVNFLKVLKDYRVECIKDIDNILDLNGFESAITSIKGQSSGISLKYFYMLAGNDDLIKPDRMILRFLKRALGYEPSQLEAQKILFDTAAIISGKLGYKISASYLDNKIWQYQRTK